jgi:hypothetical protein
MAVAKIAGIPDVVALEVPRMPAPRIVRLSAEQVAELTTARDHHPKPYVRERAAAIVKVAAGASIRAVARTGLLKPHRPDTVAVWIERYLADGLGGLLIRPGRGRKPAFPPPHPNGGAACAA